MGDIFDLLVGEIHTTHDFAKPYILLLEELAKDIEIFYFEGNHDFNLATLFNKVKVFPFSLQPFYALLHTSTGKNYDFILAHGDIFLNPLTQFFLQTLRNHILLYFFNFLNTIFCGFFSRQILARQRKKNLFYRIKNFGNFARQRYKKYKTNTAWVVEGHYHQNYIINEEKIKYFNLGSFAYEGSFFRVQYEQEIKFEELKLRGQNV
ncbi:UDP-2,3-diacylglucosamine diphosphatase [Campylobacter sp. MIT 21-1685]|nr:UDP-2,3-diacylglucosamine diphosphatase [Campylobacter sp. MIT 21-1684]MCX2750900.1 UDP-2,3-diacylglucosamine diphosphatase [Campylobacter sp. MIT 21-1682]MCX2807167.1 UDP-2,3-diacylglucosamine diphosphatase [Campylobacter sp. MIT 21-1685]